jgi:hypothetical protein
MSTTLATASIGLQYGVFTEGVLASLVVLAIVSIVAAPFLAKWALGVKIEKPSKFERLWRGKSVEETPLHLYTRRTARAKAEHIPR